MTPPAQDPPRHASITVPYPLSDETAAALIELLHEITGALESQCHGQLKRGHQPRDERQADLWGDSKPPF